MARSILPTSTIGSETYRGPAVRAAHEASHRLDGVVQGDGRGEHADMAREGGRAVAGETVAGGTRTGAPWDRSPPVSAMRPQSQARHSLSAVRDGVAGRAIPPSGAPWDRSPPVSAMRPQSQARHSLSGATVPAHRPSISPSHAFLELLFYYDMLGTC